MNKFSLIILTLIIIFTSVNAQSWQQSMDSTTFYKEKQDFRNALKWGRLALIDVEKEFGKNDTNYSATIASIGEIYFYLGNIDSAIYYQEINLAINKALLKADNPVLIGSINNMVFLYNYKGDYIKSEALYKESLEICREIYLTDNPVLATSINNIAVFYNERSRYAEAEPLFKELIGMVRRLYKEDHIEKARSLFTLADFYHNWGRYDEAEPYYKESNEMYRHLIKGDNPELSNLLKSMARFYKEKGLYVEAESLFKESLEMQRRIYKGDNNDIASTIMNMARFYDERGKTEEAESFFKEAMEMKRRIYKGDNADLSNFITWMASFYNSKGRFTEAEPLFNEALEMNKRIFKGDHPEVIKNIGWMASLYNNIGKYKEADSLYGESLRMNRNVFKGDNPILAGNLSSIAEFYYLRGRYAEAELLYKESTDISRRLYKGDHPDLANSIIVLAIIYYSRGKYAQAEPLYKEAVEMNRRIYKVDHINLAASLGKMAEFYSFRGMYSEAEPLYREALEMLKRLFKTDNLATPAFLNGLAMTVESQGKNEEAESLYKEGTEMYRRIYKSDHLSLANSINNLALFYSKNGRFIEAEPLIKESVEMKRRLFQGDHSDLINGISNMAFLYQNMGRYAEAEVLLKESLEMAKRLYNGDHLDLGRNLNSMALLYNITGRQALAEPLFVEGLKIYMNMINNYFPSLSEKEKKKFWGTVSDGFEGFNTFAVERSESNPGILSNMYDLQLYSKGLLFNSTSKVKNRILKSGDTGLIEKYKELSDKKELLVKLYTMSDNARKKKGFNLDSSEKVTNELEKELSLKSELYPQSYDKKKVTWNLVQGLLKPDEAAVEVIRFRFRDKRRFTDTIYYALLIVTDKTEDHPDLVVFENGNQLENEFYNQYRDKIARKEKDSISFARFWGKLNDKLKGYKKIYFSADGIYNKLNPSTLMMPDGKYLLDMQDIQQVNSTKDILLGFYKSKEESNIYNNAVLVGNPNFSLTEEKVIESNRRIRGDHQEDKSYEFLAASRGTELTRLPGTEKEIKNVEKFLKNKNWVVKSYLGDLAVKDAVMTANSPRVLHIATHGLFLEDVKRGGKELFGFEEQKMLDNPLLRSGLFFTGADNYLKSDNGSMAGDENGLFTAYEAMNLDLDKTELVVLSACETGLGEIQNGEGVFGLRRAFQQAGARTVLMSLWKVNDEATQELMSNFYRNWVTGMTKREAFAKAQQEVRNKFKDPYYWGAFVMVGE